MSSLHKFAETIINAFNFELDHSFGFYSNINDIYKSNEVYTLFYDTDSSLIVIPNEKSVKNSYIYKVFEPGKKMIFLFDYGDNWEFLVECCGITEAETETRYPKVTKKQVLHNILIMMMSNRV
ncbi:IS1096 element passenger TnpR family protein [Wolbachia endosymbiont of Kerria lacca]|uniref:IS1096 element passenger TnpR family protein n=1 Tax=Wolbachia endosymbiont of Kerria lacca TaxID=427705 RepID=UPI003F665627